MKQEGNSWLVQQVEQYETLPFWRTARWQATIAIVLFVCVTLTFAVYSGALIWSNTVASLAVIAVFDFFAHRGHRWAIALLMILFAFQIVLVFNLVSSLIWLIAMVTPLYRSYRVETERVRRLAMPSSQPPSPA